MRALCERPATAARAALREVCEACGIVLAGSAGRHERAPGRMSPLALGGVPDETGLGRVALVLVAGRCVEVGGELVAVLLAGVVVAEREAAIHVRQRAAVDLTVACVAGRLLGAVE